MQGTGRGPENLTQPGEGLRFAIIAVNVPQQRRQLREGGLVEATVPADARVGARSELIEIPILPGNPDDGDIEAAPFYQRLQRRKNLLVSEISCCAKEHESIRLQSIHRFVFRRLHV